jgi:hypothetical protein
MTNDSENFNLWNNSECATWHTALDGYPSVIAAQGSERLTRLDRWYLEELPALIKARSEPFITLDELKEVTSWKMARGVWRERNRWLVSGNAPEAVEAASRQAFAAAPDPRKPISTLSTLAGVGPATASAVMAAHAPETYPFFDELVAAQIPGLGPIDFTLKYYVAYAQALRERAIQLTSACPHRPWTPHDLAQALWAASGGKVALAGRQ